MMESTFFWVIALPLIGFLINGLLGLFNIFQWRSDFRKNLVGWLASVVILLPFVLLFVHFLKMSPDSKTIIELYRWFQSGDLTVNVSYQVDSLSVLMGLVVTGVGFLIHVYSIAYMHHDEGFWRFFTYLNLFIFAMLNLIFADNLVLMFLGWEGVGLCSYLLIGFWYKKEFANNAAIKAFVMNRIGDFAFLLGVFLIFKTIGTLTFDGINSNVHLFSDSTLFWAGLLLFIGATGKSAQIPLYTWLPDAMAGPTPVSALIHAATMVTAGVYLTARLSPLFSASTEVMSIIAIIGGLTALLAATIGLFQTDIKKVLAYSTVSQLGFMFLASGVGAFSAAIFHVFTHAFFKACLFLGSGSVIHAMNDEQDISRMGGLKKYLPSTYITFLIATFAIAGFPLTAGFFSKDEILFQTFANNQYGLWALATFSALLTAVYMMRLTSLTFYGEHRGGKDSHPHESPVLMTIPLWILAGLALVTGFLGLPGVITEHNWINTWLSSSVVSSQGYASHSTEWILIVLSASIGIVGLFIGYTFYTKKLKTVEKLKSQLSGIYTLVFNKYFIDEVYAAVVQKPYNSLSGFFTSVEKSFMYPLLGWAGNVPVVIGESVRLIQNGHIPTYIILFIAGVAGILGYFILG